MQRETFIKKTKKIAAGTAVFLFLAALCLCAVFLWEPILQLAKEPQIFREWIDRHAAAGRIVYLAVVIVQVFIAVLPGEPVEIFAGYAFGTLEGTLLCLGGMVLGSVLVFLFVRRFGMKAVTVFFPEEKVRSLKFLQTSRRREILFFFIFLLPGTPKDLLSYYAGLTDIRLSTWLLICTVGRIPSLLTSTVGGDALGMGNYAFALTVFGITLLLSGAGLLLYRILSSRRGKPQ